MVVYNIVQYVEYKMIYIKKTYYKNKNNGQNKVITFFRNWIFLWKSLHELLRYLIVINAEKLNYPIILFYSPMGRRTDKERFKQEVICS